MRWFEHLSYLVAQRVPLVMVTLIAVRGHAPREAGAKMLVTADAACDTIGGGNLEATAVELARQMLARGTATTPQMHTIQLTEHAPAQYGVQCCGGEVTILLEQVTPTRPAVAIFGVGHVGLALARVLSICSIELWLVDSRAAMLSPDRLNQLQPASAILRNCHAPIPEMAVHDLPANAHLLVMTHDHAEDIAILDAALRRPNLGFIGLIGSSTKWHNFQRKLLQQGFTRNDLERVTSPIGVPGIASKAPEAIAIAAAAQLLGLIFPENLPGQEPEATGTEDDIKR
ncbi:xanthine dehydrogenase accessory protein XdhC [uncultured Meiothermus sp.]|jgi:xanthine dehydrogenase accessory factor|uniref:xanthine dehydrogenase accessory protein XdhC n=1 Tax=uncultured Meiothermus sp. TaxID=157471 RepID=UPI002604904E|nr:xanthine dehydrogenase accessory protein XdhC [uncultured Meiothermus sp.]